jgi:hypothetical protein
MEIELLKILDLFSRANQNLLHANYGLAEEEMLTARDKLVVLADQAPEGLEGFISEMVEIVEEIITELPLQPDLASERLQVAWQLGVQGFPAFIGTPTPFFTPTPSATPTP